MNLREYLDEYRVLTLELIDAVQKDLDAVCLIKKREDILNSINSFKFDEQEMKELGNSMNLLELEEELQNSVIKEKIKVKKQIEDIKKARNVNTNYNSMANVARIFNKTI